jgi:nucleoside-diphosphate-sugar epimerase
MKIMIVGGTGLISTPITRELVGRGDAVTVFNRGRAAGDLVGRIAQIVGDRTDAARFEAQIAPTVDGCGN